jgi:exodeoxyribonuclease VII large subunit
LEALQARACEEIKARLARAGTRLDRTRASLSRALSAGRQRHAVRTARAKEGLFRSTSARLQREDTKLEHLRGLLRRSTDRKVEREHARLARLAAALHALDPSGVLSRGYAILADARGRVVSSIAEVQQARTVIIRMHDGELAVEIARTSTSEEPVHDPELRAKCASSRNHRRRTR